MNKKISGYIASCVCYGIGEIFARISYVRNKNGDFIFDAPRLLKIGMWLASQYQLWMGLSVQAQYWAANKRPWKSVKNG